MNLHWIKTEKFRIAIMPRPRGGDWLPDDIEFVQGAEDRSVPEGSPEFGEFIDRLNADLHAGLVIAIHCRAGIGGSSLIAACLSIRQAMRGDEALAMVEAARGCAIPDTPEQRTWIKKFENRCNPAPNCLPFRLQ